MEAPVHVANIQSMRVSFLSTESCKQMSLHHHTQSYRARPCDASQFNCHTEDMRLFSAPVAMSIGLSWKNALGDLHTEIDFKNERGTLCFSWPSLIQSPPPTKFSKQNSRQVSLRGFVPLFHQWLSMVVTQYLCLVFFTEQTNMAHAVCLHAVLWESNFVFSSKSQDIRWYDIFIFIIQ